MDGPSNRDRLAVDLRQQERRAGRDLDHVLLHLVVREGHELGVHLPRDAAEGLGRDVAERLARAPREVRAVQGEEHLGLAVVDVPAILQGREALERLDVGLLAHPAAEADGDEVGGGVRGVHARDVHGDRLGVVDPERRVVLGVARAVRVRLVAAVGDLHRQTDVLEHLGHLLEHVLLRIAHDDLAPRFPSR